MAVPTKLSMRKFQNGAWTNVGGQGNMQALKPNKESGNIFVTTGLAHEDWKHLGKRFEAFYSKADDGKNLAFELHFMEEHTHRMKAPTRMQLMGKPVYSLDRADLDIRTSEDPSHMGDCTWRELQVGVDVTKPQGDEPMYARVYASAPGDRMSEAIANLQTSLEEGHGKVDEPDVAIVTFVSNVIWIAVDQFAICLEKNADFLWKLAHQFADDAKPSELGFAKEFYQIAFRMVGLHRRFDALSRAVHLIKHNEMMQAYVSADQTGFLRERQANTDTRLEPLKRKMEYIDTSFKQMIPMVVDVTSSKRADAANNLAASGRVIAFAALAYSPASIAVGIFGMEVDFIRNLRGSGVGAFLVALMACYVPVLLWVLYSLFFETLRDAFRRRKNGTNFSAP